MLSKAHLGMLKAPKFLVLHLCISCTLFSCFLKKRKSCLGIVFINVFAKKYEPLKLMLDLEGNDVDHWFIIQKLFLRCYITQTIIVYLSKDKSKDKCSIVLFGLCILDILWLDHIDNYCKSWLCMHKIKCHV